MGARVRGEEAGTACEFQLWKDPCIPDVIALVHSLIFFLSGFSLLFSDHSPWLKSHSSPMRPPCHLFKTQTWAVILFLKTFNDSLLLQNKVLIPWRDSKPFPLPHSTFIAHVLCLGTHTLDCLSSNLNFTAYLLHDFGWDTKPFSFSVSASSSKIRTYCIAQGTLLNIL